MSSIPLYREINDLHQLTGASMRTQNPLFHCFSMEDAEDMTVTELPPHRADFYTLALSYGTENLTYTLNGDTFHQLQNFVLCVAPGQVAKWQKRGTWKGYCTFFKSSFLHFGEQLNFLQQYPFFSIQETNIIPLDPGSFESCDHAFKLIISEQEQQKDFGIDIIRSYFQAILWQVRRLYEANLPKTSVPRAAAVISAQFQYLVNEHFASHNTVAVYAELLHISANHLSQTVKAATGRTAKEIINERRLNEAKYLLTYTNENISEIAYQLQFSEPTHFTKFFRKAVNIAPSDYRLRHQKRGLPT